MYNVDIIKVLVTADLSLQQPKVPPKATWPIVPRVRPVQLSTPAANDCFMKACTDTPTSELPRFPTGTKLGSMQVRHAN